MLGCLAGRALFLETSGTPNILLWLVTGSPSALLQPELEGRVVVWELTRDPDSHLWAPFIGPGTGSRRSGRDTGRAMRGPGRCLTVCPQGHQQRMEHAEMTNEKCSSAVFKMFTSF